MLSLLQAGCPSCCPTNSVKALKALSALKLQQKLILPPPPNLLVLAGGKGARCLAILQPHHRSRPLGPFISFLQVSFLSASLLSPEYC